MCRDRKGLGEKIAFKRKICSWKKRKSWRKEVLNKVRRKKERIKVKKEENKLKYKENNEGKQ